MTSLHSAYTPLESLLLFQALRAEGVHPISFNRISEQLKSIPLVQNDPSYDSGRLSPDALRELYLGLLKDEVKRDLEQKSTGDTQHATTNGNTSPGSRKRKAASPSLPTVHEAAQHNHLIPQLVSRLYTRYRDNIVRGLRDDERRYDLITRDLAEIEAGKWDDRLQRLKTPSARPSPKPPTAVTSPSAATPSEKAPSTRPNSANVTRAHTPVESNAGLVKRAPLTVIDAVLNHGSGRSSSPAGRRVPSPNPASLASDMTPDPPRPENSDPPQPPNPGQQQPSQSQPPKQTVQPAHQSPYPMLPVPSSAQTVNSPGTHTRNGTPRPLSPARPVVLPPTGVNVPPQLAQHSASAGTPTPKALPSQQEQHSTQQQNPSQPPLPPPHLQSLPQRSHPDGHISYQAQPPQTPTYPGQPARGAGKVLAPFQAASHVLPKAPYQTPQQRPPLPPSLEQQFSQPVPFPHRAPATAPRLATHAPSPMMFKILQDLATPPRQASRIRPVWKSERRPTPIHASAEPARPEAEPMSPTHERMRSPARSTRSTRSRDPRPAEDSQQAPPAKVRAGRRRTNARAGSPHSVVSSVVDEPVRGRTRSQSVSTAAGTTAASDEPVIGNGPGVKAEPSTPANLLEDPEATPVPVATPMSGPRTRKRKGTLQAQAAPPAKRRLQESPGAPDNEQDLLSSPPRRGNTVVAAKNFAKMCAAVMNDINSHKHASYFAHAVRDRDAPGYSEIVLQPQNLKSIRAAITAGTRAVHSAASALDSPTAVSAAPTLKSFEGSSAVELERTVDLIPPKAIVNGAQLEKELMRMFANAFMFNPGEDGMALITREIFRDVEGTLNDWRGTEREAGGDEDDEGKSKRRKL